LVEPTIAELQSTALPLCYGALNFLFTTFYFASIVCKALLLERPLF
jgi:hypothetical protein